MNNTQQQQINDFIRGQEDCKEGKPHKSQSEDYDRGYACQYELEQIKSARDTA